MSFENASPIEIGLFLTSVIIIVVSVTLLLDAALDLRSLRGSRRSPTMLDRLAWARIWTDVYALYVGLVFAVVGWRAMFLPPTDADRNGIPDLVSLLILLAFLGIVVFLLALVLFLAWTRHNVMAYALPPEPWDGTTERRQSPEIGAAMDEGGFSP